MKILIYKLYKFNPKIGIKECFEHLGWENFIGNFLKINTEHVVCVSVDSLCENYYVFSFQEMATKMKKF